MGLFSRKNQVSNLKRTGKRLLLVTGCMLSLFMVAPVMNNSLTGSMTAYAAEVQNGYTWYQSGDTWHIRDNLGNDLVNSWYQDIDGSWYLLDGTGNMMTGLIHDSITNKYYLTNGNHDGTFGRMIVQDGVYDGVSLRFNQQHDGTYGCIIDGLSNYLNLGKGTTEVSGIPNASAGGTTNSVPDGGSGGGATENNTNTEKSLDDIFDDSESGTSGTSTSGNQASFHGQ